MRAACGTGAGTGAGSEGCGAGAGSGGGVSASVKAGLSGRTGAGGCWVQFVHPKSAGGVLVELSETPDPS